MTEFDTYRLYYYSAPQYDWQVSIILLKGLTWAGRLNFMKVGRPIPANFLRNGVPELHYSINDFPNILAVLALDEPLYVSLVPSNGIGMISTSDEHIGDLDRP